MSACSIGICSDSRGWSLQLVNEALSFNHPI